MNTFLEEACMLGVKVHSVIFKMYEWTSLTIYYHKLSVRNWLIERNRNMLGQWDNWDEHS